MGKIQLKMAHFILFINRNSFLMKQILTIILFTSCFITYGQSNMGDKILTDKQENAIFIELDNIISNHYQEKKIIYSTQMTVSEKNKLNDLNIKFKNDFKNKIESIGAKYSLSQKEILSIYNRLKSKHSNHDSLNH